MSTKSAGLAVKAGYTNIKVMLKGVPGWKKSGQKVVASNKHVKDGNIVLVDVRDAAAYKKGHIPRAHSFPIGNIEDLEDELPEKKSAPVVFYGKDAGKAYKMLKKLGYKKTSVYPQGIDGWLAAGNALSTSASPEEITWKRILGKGEVALAEFMNVVENNPAGSVILDVRTKDEAATGSYPNTIHIPLDEIQANLDKLSKEKEILIHCTTGARAEMASTEIKAAGFKARFLVADVECDKDGCEAED